MTVVAGFRVESLVGQGAMGEVYRAVDQDGNVVALKLLDEPARARRTVPAALPA